MYLLSQKMFLTRIPSAAQARSSAVLGDSANVERIFVAYQSDAVGWFFQAVYFPTRCPKRLFPQKNASAISFV